MQRSVLSPRDRTGAALAVLLVHGALALLLLNASGQVGEPPRGEPPIETFDVIEPPPPEPLQPPPPPEPARADETAEAQRKEEGAAAPPNIRSEATPVVLPEPAVTLPQARKVVASETPARGTDATQGAAPVPGPGTGAGGSGTGTGSGGSGAGTGGGGTGQAPRRPSVIQSTTLTGRDYPRAVLRAWPRGGRTFVAVRVQLDGRATDCKVNRSSGNEVVDQWTCRLVEQQVRFRPATDERGQPYVSWYGYVQAPVNF
nr:energy transducer TonB [uncultured Sphingomonas sp.]